MSQHVELPASGSIKIRAGARRDPRWCEGAECSPEIAVTDRTPHFICSRRSKRPAAMKTEPGLVPLRMVQHAYSMGTNQTLESKALSVEGSAEQAKSGIDLERLKSRNSTEYDSLHLTSACKIEGLDFSGATRDQIHREREVTFRPFWGRWS